MIIDGRYVSNLHGGFVPIAREVHLHALAAALLLVVPMYRAAVLIVGAAGERVSGRSRYSVVGQHWRAALHAGRQGPTARSTLAFTVASPAQVVRSAAAAYYTRRGRRMPPVGVLSVLWGANSIYATTRATEMEIEEVFANSPTFRTNL